MSITLRRRGVRGLARHGGRAWRHNNRVRMPFGNCVVDIVPVVRPVTSNRMLELGCPKSRPYRVKPNWGWDQCVHPADPCGKPFLRKWRLKCRAVAGSLEEAGEGLFSFARLPESQWKSARTTDEIDKAFLAQSAILRSQGRTAWRRKSAINQAAFGGICFGSTYEQRADVAPESGRTVGFGSGMTQRIKREMAV